MKSLRISLFVCCLLGTGVTSMVFSQTLSESFGARTTSFRITSDILDLSPIFQQVVKRGQADWRWGSDAGYGYGYESLHLEFQTTETVLIQDRFNQPYRKRGFLELQLFNQNGEQLARQELNANFLRVVSNEDETLFTYSLDLRMIPLVLLNQAEHINLLHLNFYTRSNP